MSSHYFLDSGAYDYEKEILLLDGTPLEVVSVSDFKQQQDQFQKCTNGHECEILDENVFGVKVIFCADCLHD